MSRPLRVACIMPYPRNSAGGQRFRFEQWFRLLGPDKVDVTFVPLWTDADYQLMYRKSALGQKISATGRAAVRRIVQSATIRGDVVLLFREAMPLGPPLIERWITSRRPVVYDFDDAIYLGDVSPANTFIRPLKLPEKVNQIAAWSTMTTVGNAHLAAHAARFSSHVEVVPTTLDVSRYTPAPEKRARPPVIGWSGSPTTEPHLRTIDSAIERVLSETDATFHAYGAPGYSLAGVDGVRASRWSVDTELAVNQSFSLGVMPLPDTPWTRGKCAFKALLYMAMGIPVISSSVGVNMDIIIDGENGLLADTEEDWVTGLKRLVMDDDLRDRLGEAGRQTVVEHYSGQVWAPRFLDLLHQAAETR